MTSKNLFSNLLKEDLKRRLWTIALSVLLFFIALPIFSALSIGEEGTYNTYDNIIGRLTQSVAANNPFLILITIVGAVVCGLSSFYYLHSKKKVDLYHSIPVKREKLFAVNFINGIFIYLVPYVINLLLTFLIIQVNGYMSYELFKIAIISVGINFVFYTLIYTLAVIAVMLTGNIVISFFGIGVFLSYGPIIMFVKEIYFTEFLKHYPSTISEWDLFTFLSPIGSYLHLANVQFGYSYRSNVAIFQEGLGMGILKTIITILLFITFALFLFVKRPSEAAGKAMSFWISKPIIKFLLVVPLTLLGGIIFKQIANNSGSIGWFLFGLVFTFIIISAIIEIMFNFDIRTAFRHKRHLLLCAIVVAITSSVFQLDVFKYDSYLPSKDKIDYMSVHLYGVDNKGNYINLEGDSPGLYINPLDYHLNNVKLSDFNAAYALAKIGIEDETEVSNTGNSTFTYSVKYVLKSGKEISRKYELKSKENMELLSAIYDNKEYKEVHYQIFNFNPTDIVEVSCYSQKSSKDLTLNENEKQELLTIYQKEVSAFKLADLNNEQLVTTIRFQFMNNQNVDYEVYSNFTETMEFIKNHGFNDFNNFTTDNVKEIVVNYYSPYQQKEGINYDKENIKIYTDKKEIEELLLNIVDQNLYLSNFSVMDKEEYFDIHISTISDAYGNYTGSSYFFRKDRVPDFVKEDFEIKE
jgi:ABC-2 type transport system permease protein